jgi:hypothetical protein
VSESARKECAQPFKSHSHSSCELGQQRREVVSQQRREVVSQQHREVVSQQRREVTPRCKRVGAGVSLGSVRLSSQLLLVPLGRGTLKHLLDASALLFDPLGDGRLFAPRRVLAGRVLVSKVGVPVGHTIGQLNKLNNSPRGRCRPRADQECVCACVHARHSGGTHYLYGRQRGRPRAGQEVAKRWPRGCQEVAKRLPRAGQGGQ